ncbi:Flp pilus assembly protein, ATPase CpaF [Azospira oryzae PS]|uniref:Flp pilus assembly protein, ATPase CpaF n=1 Tax=Azospira oryzae (strain ATCC BAA-33 / DSM 13638 / PS) TaxID=640081 RepID=G8QNN6_AZOOP|nr:ATPase, T2SS/T4P/T4SS family [Azospira oryzae]AEV26930.1 Flp pilus assembly protein, ATPase CpaF [Azospira oryzae PS]
MDRVTAERAMEVLWEHLDLIRPHLEDDTVQEVMINSPKDIWVESLGVMKPIDVALEDEQVDAVIRILAGLNKKADAQILEFRLPKLRVAAARHPIAMRGHSMCIRKHSARKLAIEDYVKAGAFDPISFDQVPGGSQIPEEIAANLHNGGQVLADFLKWMVQSRKTPLIGGATSSGKTTLIGALLDLVQPEDRVIIIEDTGELSELEFDLPNRVHFESNESLGVSIRDLVRLALRYRPTRIIIGEIRGAEGYDMLNAYGTGHPGGACSLHADNAPQALISLENKIRMSHEARELPLASLRSQIAQTFPYVVHAANVIGVYPPRAPTEIVEVRGVDPHTGFYITKQLYSRFI